MVGIATLADTLICCIKNKKVAKKDERIIISLVKIFKISSKTIEVVGTYSIIQKRLLCNNNSFEMILQFIINRVETNLRCDVSCWSHVGQI